MQTILSINFFCILFLVGVPTIHHAQNGFYPSFHCGNLDSLYQLISKNQLSIDSDLGNTLTPLTLSCGCGSSYLIEKYKVAFNYECPISYRTLFWYAVKSQNKALVSAFLKEGSINQLNGLGKSALYFHAEEAQDSLFLQSLMDMGATLKPHEFYTPLLASICNKNTDIFFFFLRKYEKQGLNEVIQDTSLVQTAALVGRFDIVRWLMQYHDFHKAAILEQITSNQVMADLPMTNAILHHTANYIVDVYEKQPTLDAIRNGIQLLDYLLEKGIPIHLINEHGETILAALYKIPSMVSYLATKKLDLNHLNPYGKTVLHQIINELLEESWDSDFNEKRIEFTLDRIDEFVSNGGIVSQNRRNVKQYLFFEAVRQNRLKLVELLIKRGYDPKMQDTDGKTAIQIATQSEFIGLKEFLAHLNKK